VIPVLTHPCGVRAFRMAAIIDAMGSSVKRARSLCRAKRFTASALDQARGPAPVDARMSGP